MKHSQHASERQTSRVASKRHAGVAILALLAVLSGAVVSTAVAAQEAVDAGDAEIRIVARKLDTDRIEFGLQQRQADDSWGTRQLPRVRFFPPTAGINRWLASSPLDLPAGEVRIVARKLEDGRVEFGLQQRQGDDSWGDRQFPRLRFFPTTAGTNRWLSSSPLTVSASQPADRDTTTTDNDQTAPPPADRDTTTTDDDQYSQFAGDTVEVTNPHSWWQRPRGDLVVHVHLCVEEGNEHLAKRELIDAYVRALNEIHAPFYAWQSSGLLNVSFTAGKIKIANDVPSDWPHGFLPRSCDVSLRSCTTHAHCAGAIIVAGNPRTTLAGGWGAIGGPKGATFVTDAANKTVADIVSSPRYLLVTRHEFDHNIGNLHINGAQTGPTRLFFGSLEQWETQQSERRDPRVRYPLAKPVGSLAGFPAALQQHEGITVFACYFLEEQGWPVGPNAPGCGRPAPPPPRNLRHVDWLTDGRPRVSWQPPLTATFTEPGLPATEPVTGYTIVLSRATRIGPGSYYWDDGDGVTFDLPADARSFVLPPSPIGGPIGEYQVGDLLNFDVIAQSAVGLGESASTLVIVGFRQTVIRIEEVDTGCVEGIEDCGPSGPRTFELSWPSHDLVEDWLVVGQEGTYWNRATGDRAATGVFRNSTTVAEGHEIIRGKTYEFTVFGCLKERPPGIVDKCFPYATATFTPHDPTAAVTWTDTGMWGEECETPDCPPQDLRYFRIYQAEWTHIPGRTVYVVQAKECIDASRPCQFERIDERITEPDSSGTVTAQIGLISGTRYEVDIHACGPADDASSPWSCPVALTSEITVPPLNITVPPVNT